MKTILRHLAKLVYPDGLRCISCGDELFADSENGYCEKCLPQTVKSFCKICGTFILNESQSYCDSCITGSNEKYFLRARAVYPYADDNVKNVVWSLKYGEKAYVAKDMAKDMCKVMIREKYNVDIITYVPIHKIRARERGYNQSELLAKQISEIMKIPLLALLEKLTYSKVTATKLGKEERTKTIEGSFGLIGENVRGKNILLVDDVYTTGATVNECAKMLRLAKAKSVCVITYATSRGDPQITY